MSGPEGRGFLARAAVGACVGAALAFISSRTAKQGYRPSDERGANESPASEPERQEVPAGSALVEAWLERLEAAFRAARAASDEARASLTREWEQRRGGPSAAEFGEDLGHQRQ